jgi:predicted flap endonuclease-1-like 5' DNA nuclease
MTNSTLIIIGAAVLVLALVLFLLARTGRKPIEGPKQGMFEDRAGIDAATEFSPVMPDEPLPEPGAAIAAGISAAEYGGGPTEAAFLEAAAPPPDPLTRMKGLGPKAEATLHGLGVTRYAQIAAWKEADVARIDAQMGAFKGRIARDRWVEQARYLAAGDVAGFEAVFGKLG